MTNPENQRSIGANELSAMVYGPKSEQLSAVELLDALKANLAQARDRQDEDMETFVASKLTDLYEARPDLRQTN